MEDGRALGEGEESSLLEEPFLKSSSGVTPNGVGLDVEDGVQKDTEYQQLCFRDSLIAK